MFVCGKNVFLPTKQKSIEFRAVILQAIDQFNDLTVHNFRFSDSQL